MCDLERYKIDLKGLTDEVTTLEWDLDKQFFDALDQTEVESGALHVSLSIRKASGFFELLFHTVGSVDITCDRCLDLMEQPIETDNRLVAKLGSTNSEDEGPANSVPAAAVIRKVRALSGFIGFKGSAGWLLSVT